MRQDKNHAEVPSIAWAEIFASCHDGLHFLPTAAQLIPKHLSHTQTYHLHVSHPVGAKKSTLETLEENCEQLQSFPSRTMPLPGSMSQDAGVI
jgi:hypothetical protein